MTGQCALLRHDKWILQCEIRHAWAYFAQNDVTLLVEDTSMEV